MTSYLQILTLAGPETVIALAALLVLTVDLTVMRGEPVPVRRLVSAAFAGFGCLAAFFWLLNVESHAQILNGMLVADSLIQLVKMTLISLTLFTVMISTDSTFTDHVGEYFALILLATVGALFLVSSEEILMIFVSLELTSLSLYILTAFNKKDLKSAEAALKYFLFGGMAAAFTLFGLSLLYGLTGQTNLKAIAQALQQPTLHPLLLVALVMTVIGFGFKIAAVPFHLWAPDAYQGAPTPSAAFIASASKVASFFILAKIMRIGFAGAEGNGAWGNYLPGWIPLLAAIAALSIVFGNLAALAQNNLKRLLAYSAIAHAGYALLGLLANNQHGLTSLLYYVITYGLTALGAFAVVAAVEKDSGQSQLPDFAGLGRRSPLLAFCLMIFMLSLAGIPPLAGFFGKFYLFAAAAGSAKNLGLLWLVIVAIAFSAVSLYYYLVVLKQVYVAEPPADAPPIQTNTLNLIAVIAMAAGVLLLGCAPDLLISRLLAAAHLAAL